MHKLLACAFVGAAVLASGDNSPGDLTYVRAALLQEPDRRLLRALTA
jgi:hypothetical protein